jgi:hypothetical protein
VTGAPQHGAAPRERAPISVDLTAGRLETAGRAARFDPSAQDALELAYLRLVRELRDVRREPSFVLRSADVAALAAATRRDAAEVLDRLGELMGATAAQRRSMVTAFAAGALLIAVATGAAALSAGGDDLPGPRTGERVEAAGEVVPELDLVGPDADTDAEADDPAAADDEDDGADEVAVATGGAVAAADEVDAPAPRPAPAPRTPVTTSPPATPPAADERPQEPRPVRQPGAGPDLPADEDDVEIIQPGPIEILDEDDVEIVQPGAEIVQPGADIDIPADEHDDVEIIQPGADIDIPPDDGDDDEDGDETV